MKCMNRNIRYSVAAVGVTIFFVAPSARHYLPLLASLACPLSMLLMMGGASLLPGNESAPSSAPTTTSDANTNDSPRDADLSALRARITELEQKQNEPKILA